MDLNPEAFKIYKMIRGRPYQYIGKYPKDERFISDMIRSHRRIGYVIEVLPDEYDLDKIKMYKSRVKK